MKMTSRSDLDVIVIMILYEVRASKKRREWLDAICRLIIWTTLSSETSIPRANLTSTSRAIQPLLCLIFQRGPSKPNLTSYNYCRDICTKRARYLTR